MRGLDLRDLWRPGLQMTLRRVLLLIRALPPEATLWPRLEAAEKKAESDSLVARLRAKQAFYDKQAKEAAP